MRTHPCVSCVVLVHIARPETVKHGLSTFVRLVRAILGPTSISDSKVECGMALVILGILVRNLSHIIEQPLLCCMYRPFDRYGRAS